MTVPVRPNPATSRMRRAAATASAVLWFLATAAPAQARRCAAPVLLAAGAVVLFAAGAAVASTEVLAREATLPARGRAQDAAPWPRLPDGRVVVEAKGHRLAFGPDLRPGEVQFVAVPRGRPIPLREVIDDPARAREVFAAAHSVWAWLANAHNAPGRFDRRSLPDTRVFRIGLYDDPAASACAGPPWAPGPTRERLCARFARLALDPPALGEAGFVVAPGRPLGPNDDRGGVPRLVPR